MTDRMIRYKLAVLGDGGVGKTALTVQLCLEHFVETYDPTIEDSYVKKVSVYGQPCKLEIVDTGGQDAIPELRDQWIRDGEGFLLVYSISSRESFSNIEELHRRILEVKGWIDSQPVVPITIVGNKVDRTTEREVGTQDGRALAYKLGITFVEASAKNATNVEEAFYGVVRTLRMRQRAASGSRQLQEGESGTGGNLERDRQRENGCGCIVL